jgi:hypothetical protein
MMTGKDQHILFTERNGETFLDVKRALLPHLNFSPKPDLRQLVLSLKNGDGSYDPDVDDDRVIPGDVELELIIKTLPMNAEQQSLIDKWTRTNQEMQRSMNMGDTKYYVRVFNTDVNTPDKMEAFLFHIKNNQITTLDMMFMDIHQIMLIMRSVVSEDIPIESLIFQGDDTSEALSPDEIRDVFEMVGQMNTLRSLKISNDCNLTYRMNDLADLLEQTYLTHVEITRCNIILDGDSRLSHVLMNHPTLSVLSLSGQSGENITDFIESFQHIIPMRSNRNTIKLYWTNQ